MITSTGAAVGIQRRVGTLEACATTGFVTDVMTRRDVPMRSPCRSVRATAGTESPWSWLYRQRSAAVGRLHRREARSSCENGRKRIEDSLLCNNVEGLLEETIRLQSGNHRRGKGAVMPTITSRSPTSRNTPGDASVP